MLPLTKACPTGSAVHDRTEPTVFQLPGALYRSPLIEADVDKALFRLSTVGRFLVRPGQRRSSRGRPARPTRTCCAS